MFTTSIAISSGVIYVGSYDGNIYAFGPLSYMIEGVKKSLHEAESKGLNVSNELDFLAKAESTIQNGNYKQDKNLVEELRIKIEEINFAFSSISRAKSSIDNSRSAGFDVSLASDFFSEAESSFKNKEYRKAKDQADQAFSFAADIDQDGVLNINDFAPTIDNYYIYSGFAILLIGSVLTLKVSLKKKEKLKLEHQRREEVEINEKEKLERMKQEILDKIYEGTKK